MRLETISVAVFLSFALVGCSSGDSDPPEEATSAIFGTPSVSSITPDSPVIVLQQDYSRCAEGTILNDTAYQVSYCRDGEHEGRFSITEYRSNAVLPYDFGKLPVVEVLPLLRFELEESGETIIDVRIRQVGGLEGVLAVSSVRDHLTHQFWVMLESGQLLSVVALADLRNTTVPNEDATFNTVLESIRFQE